MRQELACFIVPLRDDGDGEEQVAYSQAMVTAGSAGPIGEWA